MNMISFDVISQEAFSFLHISLDKDFIVERSIADILDTSIVVSSPEEWDVFEWHLFAKHIESSMRALIHSCDVVLYSQISTKQVIRIRDIISCCEYIRHSRLQEFITNNGPKVI